MKLFNSRYCLQSIGSAKPRCTGVYPRRDRTAHKGDHGRVLCAGGDLGMAGAIRLAAEACARSGAGLTAVITQPDNVLSIVTVRPEIMVQGWQDKAHEISQRLEWLML